MKASPEGHNWSETGQQEEPLFGSLYEAYFAQCQSHNAKILPTKAQEAY